MGKLDPILAKAVRLLRRKKYESAVKALEPEVNRFYGVFHYYYILALSYLYAKVFNVAFTYFKLARDIKMRDTQVLLGFAALYLRRGETDRAVDLYLEAQDLDPRNKQARQALKIIKKYSGTEHLSAWVESKGFFTVFPPLPKAPPGPALPLLCGACALAALALAL
ncbi:MAG: tetratricopeptide repeat protein, partial [Spirochaetaceae bacterium]|nr:tetratricopeptide repeat protein [Spirochaetaceae bacterium]